VILETLQLMGRWAQSRRRGGGPPAAPALDPPPAPELVFDEGGLWSWSQSTENTGGQVVLEDSADGLDPWQPYSFADWALEHNWGEINEFGGAVWRAREIGNNVNWSGAGAWSDPYDAR